MRNDHHMAHRLTSRRRERREVFVFDGEDIHELIERQEALERKLDKMHELLLNMSKFIHYPDWLTKEQAFEILPFRDTRTLKDRVSKGVISCRSINSAGTSLVYSKIDCLEYPELYTRWLDRNP
ncbi:MAG: hypothetical protein KI786_06915 [Mameliella sp.]|nr:hypothetical protein [Phaeodactylibacter sp.]